LVRGNYLQLPSATPEERQIGRVSDALTEYGRHHDLTRPESPQQPALVAPSAYFGGLRYLGQLHRTYLVCEGPRGLGLIDQHAAHERMNYQRLRRAAQQRKGASQPLLVPLVVTLPAASAALLGESAEALSALGIEATPFGEGSVAVQALPAALGALG